MSQCRLCPFLTNDSWTQVAFTSWLMFHGNCCDKCKSGMCVAMCHHAAHGRDPVMREQCDRKKLHQAEQRVYLNRNAAEILPDVGVLDELPILTKRSSFLTARVKAPPRPAEERAAAFHDHGFTSLPLDLTDAEVRELEGLYARCQRESVRVRFNQADKCEMDNEPGIKPVEDRFGFNISFGQFYSLSQALRCKLFSEEKLGSIAVYFGAAPDDVVVFEYRLIVAKARAGRQRVHTDALTYSRCAVSEVTAFRRSDVPGTLAFKGTRTTFTRGMKPDLAERETRITTRDQCVLFDAGMAHCGGPNDASESVRITAMYTHKEALSLENVRNEISAAVSICSWRNMTFEDARHKTQPKPKTSKAPRREALPPAQAARTLRSRKSA